MKKKTAARQNNITFFQLILATERVHFKRDFVFFLSLLTTTHPKENEDQYVSLQVHFFLSLARSFAAVCAFFSRKISLNYTAVSKYVQMLQNRNDLLHADRALIFIRPFSPVLHVQCL